MQAIDSVDRFSRPVTAVEVDLPFDQHDIPVMQCGKPVLPGQREPATVLVTPIGSRIIDDVP